MSWESDASMSSNDLDEGLQVEGDPRWLTLEGFDDAALDSMSGVAHPASHCAITGCTWCSSAEPCAPNCQKSQIWRVEQLQWTHPEKHVVLMPPVAYGPM